MEIRREDKVWVLDRTRHLRESEQPRQSEAAPLLRPRQSRPPQAPEGPAKAASERKDSRRLPWRFLLAFTIGPFAAGRRHPFWTPASALGLLVVVGLLSFGLLDGAELAKGRPVPRMLHAAAAAGLLVALAGWSHALSRAGDSLAKVRRQLPAWLRRPGLAAFVGLWLPGFALLLAGSPRRAALALWNVGMLGGALLFLLHVRSVEVGTVWIGYERLLLTALALVLVAGLLWIGWALEGLRLQLAGARIAGGLRGDRLALLLLASLGLFLLAFQPGTLSESLHGHARGLAQANYRLLPLVLERAALRLDDSRPDYWLGAAEYCERLGRDGEAARLRGELWVRWHEFRLRLGESELDLRPAATQGPVPRVSPPPTL